MDASKNICKDGASLIGLTVTDKAAAHRYGTVAGTWIGNCTQENAGKENAGEDVRARGAGPAGVEVDSGVCRGMRGAGWALDVKLFIEKPNEA